MKKIYPLFAFLMLFAATLSAQPIEHLYDVIPGLSQSAAKILPTTRGGLVIAGNVETSYTPGANNKLYLLGMDREGVQTWVSSYTTNAQLHQFSKSITPLSSASQAGGTGYFMVCGGKTGTTPVAFAVRVNQAGVELANKTSILPYEVTFNNVCNATNGGFVAVGVTGEVNAVSGTTGDAVIAKFNVQGNVLWTKKLTLPAPFIKTWGGSSIIPAPDGGYIIAGDLLVWKVDVNGNQQWVKFLNIGLFSQWDDIQPLPDGNGYLMTGWKFSNTAVSSAYAAKLDNNGNLLSNTVFATDGPNILAHGCIILSPTEAFYTATFTSDLFVRGYKFNLSNLQVTQSGYVGNTVPAWTCSILKRGNGFVMGGEGLDANFNGNFYSFITDQITLTNFAPTEDRSASIEQPSRQINKEALLKAAEERLALIAIWEADRARAEPQIALFPNPASDILQFSLNTGLEQVAKVEVLNSTGQVVQMAAWSVESPAVQVQGLANGTYFLAVTLQNGQVLTEGFVVARSRYLPINLPKAIGFSVGASHYLADF